MTTELGLPTKRPEHGLYWDQSSNNGQGARISTHSMLKTFRTCPKQAEYKYVHRLKPKKLGTPLKRGTWWHSLLEADGRGEDWREVHEEYTKQFNQMFDEEKEYYGDMPTELKAMMLAYKWHYKKDEWEYIDNEFQLEATLPDGTIYRGKVDALIKNFRLLDAQSALYLWAAEESGLKVNGFIWNYARWKVPTVPKLLVKGDRISKSAVDTDYPTYVRALKKYKAENPNFVITQENRDRAAYLKSQQYEFGKPQTSDFFRRDVLEKSPDMLERVVQGNYTTSLRMHDYDFSNPDYVERNVGRNCTFQCSYTDLCTAELMGANTKTLIKQNYTSRRTRSND
jgi:hypothetical protein